MPTTTHPSGNASSAFVASIRICRTSAKVYHLQDKTQLPTLSLALVTALRVSRAHSQTGTQQVAALALPLLHAVMVHVIILVLPVVQLAQAVASVILSVALLLLGDAMLLPALLDLAMGNLSELACHRRHRHLALAVFFLRLKDPVCSHTVALQVRLRAAVLPCSHALVRAHMVVQSCSLTFLMGLQSDLACHTVDK